MRGSMGPSAIREVKHITDLSRAYRRHVHDELSIAHVWAGSTLAWIQGREVPISGECLVLIAPGVAHACNPDPGSGWNYTQVLLDPGAWGDCLEGAYRVASSTSSLQAAFRRLRGQERGADASVAVVLAELFPGAGGIPPVERRHSAALRRVHDHLHAHLATPLDLEDLRIVSRLSKYHLVRAFKEAYGLTPHAYHLNLRVNAAKRRLQEGEDLAAVALETGFCDQSHFTRVFARCVGMTPAVYRKLTAIPSKTPGRPRS